MTFYLIEFIGFFLNLYMMRKLGVRFSPPALVLVYDHSFGKIHKRTMPIRNFRTDSNIPFCAKQMVSRHEEHLGTVPAVKIEKMLRILQEHLKGLPLDAILVKVQAEYEVKPDEDLNKLSPEELRRKKLSMDESFLANQLHPNDQGFEYDKRIDFPEGRDESGWDQDIEESGVSIPDDADDFWG